MSLIEAIRRKIRRYGRQIFRPMTVDEAAEKKEVLAIAYFFSTLLLIGYVHYAIFMRDDPMDKMDTKERLKVILERHQIDEKNIKVLKFKSFKRVDEFYLNQDEEPPIEVLSTDQG